MHPCILLFKQKANTWMTSSSFGGETHISTWSTKLSRRINLPMFGSVPPSSITKGEKLNEPSRCKNVHGEVFDCVDIFKQPAFDHSVLKDHRIQYAVASMPGSGLYHGTGVTLNVWNPQPNTTTGGIFSLAQLWVASGPSQEINTIEAGWQADGYQNTGCYNLRCSGFVQVDQNIMPEMTLPTSVAGVDQARNQTRRASAMKKLLFVKYIWVGYWPSSLLTYLAQKADRIDWGGETTGTPSGSYPPIGSGTFPNAGPGYAGYASRIHYH
ncbi:hypothetical protein H6P81_012096 [Aristolochia fimbriata]|uniref:Neprosin PEP catalytic domain-containing protein n=1 Tax=Aristolochia fimbriata TaxID=158543 RepID=A0AAV7EFF7_ARIFI|nr:hypothetical protein H6P81_012096 [Aristolochia fimbriata]